MTQSHEEITQPWRFPFCPQPPDWSLDWDAVVAEFDWVRDMGGCPQDPVWHAEGDVLTHTHMVCEALTRLVAWRLLPPEDRSVMFAAALLHDVAKPQVTRKERGRIRSPRHAAKGALMARTLLARDLLPTTSQHRFQLREQIVGLVRHHGLPLYFLNGGDPSREVWTASQVARCDRLAMVAQADVMGRVSEDQQEMFNRVDFFQDYCAEQQCLDRPRQFASDHTRVVFFHGRRLDPDCEAYDDTQFEVILLSGLPGSGKDHWIRNEGPGWPVVSLDVIRDELRITAEENQGAVVAEAKETARGLLRDGSSFIWNATNTTAMMRKQLIRLFRDYGARVRIVYVEAPWRDILQRNRQRTVPIPESALDGLLAKLEVPNVTEAHHVEYIVP